MASGEIKAERRYGGLSAAERRAVRRERLMKAGLELFGTAGFQKTTIPQLCSSAAVTTAHFYAEFPSREALLTAVYDEVAHGTFEGVRAALRSRETPVHARVRAANLAYFTYLTEDPRRARVYALEMAGISPELELHRRTLREAFVKQSTKAAERAHTAGVDHRLLSVALSGAANALLVEWVIAARRPSLAAMTGQLTALWLRTLGISEKEDF